MIKTKFDVEEMRKNPARSTLMIVNEISKLFDENMMKHNENPIMKEKTARLILAHLSHKDGVPQQELVKITQMKGSTVSVAVTKMENAGYIKRIPSEYDMRSVNIFLTKKGKEISDKTKALLDEKDKKIMQGISDRDIRVAKYVLEKMLDNLVEL